MSMSARALRAGALLFALTVPVAACGDDDDDGAGDGDGQSADAGTSADAGGDAAPGDGGAGDDAVALPGKAAYPEGITSLADGTLFVSSVSQGTIFRAAPGATEADAEPFAEGGDNGLLNTVGLLADEKRGTLWACSSDFGELGTSPPGLKAFDLASGEAAGSFDLPGGGFCNDIAIDAEGNVYVTDSFAPRILVLPAGEKALEVWLEDDRFGGDGFNLNGIEVDGEDLYTVKSNTGELFQIPIRNNGSAGQAEVVELERALETPDGLRLEASGTLIVVEGVGRLTRIELGGKAPELTVVREGLDGPTTATLVGDSAWVVEGQLVHLIDPKSGSPDLPFKVVRVPLR